MDLVERFIVTYLKRGMILSVVGGFLATIGLVAGIAVGVTSLEMLGMESAFVYEDLPKSSIKTGAVQLVGLMLASVLFVFANSLLGAIPFVGSFSGFSNSLGEALIGIGKALVFIAFPLTVCFILSTILISQMMYIEGNITYELRNVVIGSTMSMFPMVMFYQIGAEKLTL